jgi:hypothetical protein
LEQELQEEVNKIQELDRKEIHPYFQQLLLLEVVMVVEEMLNQEVQEVQVEEEVVFVLKVQVEQEIVHQLVHHKEIMVEMVKQLYQIDQVVVEVEQVV